MEQLILDILEKQDNITNIEDISINRTYANKTYKYIYRFLYKIDDIDIPVVIGVPDNWDRKLISVYIENYKEIKYIPHLGCGGSLCLFDLEGVLIDKNFEGLLKQTLYRVKKTISDGLNERNKEDFIEEFELYWEKLPNIKILKSFIEITEGVKIVKCADDQKPVKKKKGDKYIDVLKKQNNYRLVCSDSEKDINMYQGMNTVKNGIYISLNLGQYLYPPDWRENLDISYVNNLLNHETIDKELLTKYISKCKGDLVIIFSTKQPNGCSCMFGVIIKGFSLITKPDIKLETQQDLIPCAVTRCDKDFLLNRGGAISGLYDKNVLVIGCGSIGGYIIGELVKTGTNNITIVDDDLLKEENIYRHFLGMEYINEYKAKALVEYTNKNIPNVNIHEVISTIEDAIADESVSFSEYDLIISAVGNHNVNRWINEFIHIHNIKTPVIYIWNEILGIGNHVAFISTDYDGCYECFFGMSNEEIYDKTSYCGRGQAFTKTIRGCGSSYLPYGSTTSIISVTTGIEVIRNYFEDRIKNNFLLSVKGNDYYFKKAGFVTSDRYNKQSDYKIMIEGGKFKKEGCMCCGVK